MRLALPPPHGYISIGRPLVPAWLRRRDTQARLHSCPPFAPAATLAPAPIHTVCWSAGCGASTLHSCVGRVVRVRVCLYPRVSEMLPLRRTRDGRPAPWWLLKGWGTGRADATEVDCPLNMGMGLLNVGDSCAVCLCVWLLEFSSEAECEYVSVCVCL